MKLHSLKLQLRFVAIPLLGLLVFSGNVLCKDVSADNESTISQKEAQNQAEREVGRLWLIALPHLTPEEREAVTKYLQTGIQRDYDQSLKNEKSK